METIVLDAAGKCYKDIWVFRNVSASFSDSKIYGLVGRNGSGKTMLLKSICGLVRINEGKIYVEGKEVGTEIDVPESVGAIIEVPGFLPNLSGFANLKYLAKLKNKISDQDIRDTLAVVGLDPNSRQHVGKYSLGMRQRLGIAQAIMENPNILLLDEPMNGLDQQGVNDMKVLLSKLRMQGKTIILASHHSEDIEELCDEVYRMDGGMLYHVNTEEYR